MPPQAGRYERRLGLAESVERVQQALAAVGQEMRKGPVGHDAGETRRGLDGIFGHGARREGRRRLGRALAGARRLVAFGHRHLCPHGHAGALFPEVRLDRRLGVIAARTCRQRIGGHARRQLGPAGMLPGREQAVGALGHHAGAVAPGPLRAVGAVARDQVDARHARRREPYHERFLYAPQAHDRRHGVLVDQTAKGRAHRLAGHAHAPLAHGRLGGGEQLGVVGVARLERAGGAHGRAGAAPHAALGVDRQRALVDGDAARCAHLGATHAVGVAVAHLHAAFGPHGQGERIDAAQHALGVVPAAHATFLPSRQTEGRPPA